MSEQDTSGARRSATPPSKNSSQETLEASNKLRFILLFISIIISLLVAPFFLTDNIFKICIFFATFTTLIFALTDLIIYLSKESPSLITPQIDPAEKGYKTNKNPLISSTKNVVHYIQRRQTGASRIISSILKNKWITETLIIAIAFPASLIVAEHWKDIIGEIVTVFEFFVIKNKSLGISILATIIVALIIFRKMIIETFQQFISSLTSKYFVFTLASLAIIGALSALLIPSYTSWFREPGYTSAQQESTKETPEKAQNTPSPTPSSTDNKAAEVEQKSTSDLRLHLLYITGGIIAILGLIETNRKNSQDHIRQVHTARRDRYIQAVDKLSSKEAPVRLGGVYALVGLVDEWLDDESINQETRFKEGQVIINNLCAYIRSPFSPAARVEEYQTYNDYERLKSEVGTTSIIIEDVRRYTSIFSRFEHTNYQEPDTLVTDTDAFHEEQDVRRTIFAEMSKRSSTFRTGKNIKDVTIIPGAWSVFDFDFSRAPIFYSLDNLTIEKPHFPHARFYGDASFNTTNFIQNADFSHVFYIRKVKFTFARFFQSADFTFAGFFQDADFMFTKFSQDAIFQYTHFSETANFIKANFGEGAYFNEATFNKEAQIGGVTFTQKAEFIKTFFFQETNFVNTTFTQKVDFGNTTFKKYEPIFVREDSNARFSASIAQEDYNFSPRSDSRSIQLGKAELDGIIRWIPVGAVLFDPDSWDEEKWKYTRESKPAKPLENSDAEEEKTTK